MKLPQINLQNFERALGFVGIGVIVYMIYRLGPGRIAANMHAVNWGIFVLVLLRGVRYICQPLAWKLILADRERKISFWKLFKTNLQGESLNYITVTRIGGEPLKAVMIKGPVTLAESAASVIVLKFSTIFAFWLVITSGFMVTLLNSDVTGEIKRNIGLGVLGLTLFLATFSWLQRVGVYSPVSWLMKKLKLAGWISSQFKLKRELISQQVLRLTRLDSEILEAYRSRPGRVILAVIAMCIAWAEEIVFVWVTLRFLNMQENWLLPTVVATISLLFNSLFFFVPLRAGTQEGTMVLAFTLLDLSEPVGLSVAILKRIRELFWVFLGLSLFSLETLYSQEEPLEVRPPK